MPRIVTSSRRRRPRGKSPRHVPLVVSAIVLCLLAALCVTLRRKAPVPGQSPAPPPPAPVDAPVETPVADEAPAPRRPPASRPHAAPPQAATAEPTNIVSRTVVTNRSGAVIEKIRLADGRTMSRVEPPKPVFSNAAEQVIALALSTAPGESMPPLPDLTGLEGEFEKALKEPVVINEDDTDEVKELKERVAEAKEYLAKELEKGGTIADILKEHQTEMERIGAAHLEAIREIQAIRAERGEEAAAAYAEKANEAFREDGIPELPAHGAAAEKTTEEAQ